MLLQAPIVWPTTSGRASSSVCRIFSPPGTSPTPVWPELSVRITMLRVKNGAMRAAQIEQHAVAAGDRDHLHCSDDRRAGKTGAYSVLNHVNLPRQARLGLRSSLATDVHCAAKSLRQLAKETGDHLCPKLVARLAGLKLETHHPVIEPVSTRAGTEIFDAERNSQKRPSAEQRPPAEAHAGAKSPHSGAISGGGSRAQTGDPPASQLLPIPRISMLE